MNKQEVSFDTLQRHAEKYGPRHSSVYDKAIAWGNIHGPIGYYPAHINLDNLDKHGFVVISWGRR